MFKIKLLIESDLIRNSELKNHSFFYVFRLGNMCINADDMIRNMGEFFFRLIMKMKYNKYNHIPLETKIGGGLRLPHLLGIVISGNAIIGKECTIMHQVTIGVDDIGENNKAPIIGNNVFIGAGAKIIGDITIGDNVIIGAGAIITKNVPSGKTVVGINQILPDKKSK